MTQRRDDDDDAMFVALERELASIETGSYIGLDPLEQLDAVRVGGRAVNKLDRLHVAQTYRAAGLGPDELGFFYVAFLLDQLVDDEWIAHGDLAEVLRGPATAIDEFWRAAGVEAGGDWPDGEPPPGFAEAEANWDAAFEKMRLAVWRRHDPLMADLLAADPTAVDERIKVGRLMVFGRLPGEGGSDGNG